MMSEFYGPLQWAMAGLAMFGYVALWRMDAATRATKRLQKDHQRAVDQLKKYAADWGQLNQKRAAINARYDDTVTKIRDKFGIKDSA